MHERTEAVRRWALELGFDRVGFAAAGPADPDGRLRAWLRRGFAADMSYMDRTAAEREDPRRYVEGARSVVSLAVSYFDPAAEEHAPPGGVARYARGDDYHRRLKRKVRSLRKRIIEMAPGAKVAPTVDTSPVLEREWARRAGVAWIGKSTMAISQDLGTYTFLATLVTDVELRPDDPHPDRCGTCTACLDACPTDAFVGPYELDARRCITYWTVEHREAFTAETPPLHGWVAGCDVCQEVCPWNKFARPTPEPRFRARPELATPDIVKMAADVEHARAVVQGTALQRTGGPAMQRNSQRVLEEQRGGDGPPRP